MTRIWRNGTCRVQIAPKRRSARRLVIARRRNRPSRLRWWRRSTVMTLSSASSWRLWSQRRRRAGADASCRGDALTPRTGCGAMSKAVVTVTVKTVPPRTARWPAAPRRTMATPTTLLKKRTVGSGATRRRPLVRSVTARHRHLGAPTTASSTHTIHDSKTVTALVFCQCERTNATAFCGRWTRTHAEPDDGVFFLNIMGVYIFFFRTEMKIRLFLLFFNC